jgi:hypothetical protein
MNATPISKSPIRARWAALGAAVAVSLGAGGLGIVQATGPDGASAYVPINPCRLADTRPDTSVGPHTTPLGPDTAVTYDGWGDVPGDCDLPTGATGLQLNVTAVGATQLTNLRLYPTGTPLPATSNLNPAPGAAPTPNGVTVTLNGDGQFDVFNRFGQVDVVIDVAGYYTDHDHDDRYYTKDQTDAAIAASGGGSQIDAYTKAETDTAIAGAVAGKANAADVYTQPETDAAIATAVADRPTTAQVGEAFDFVLASIYTKTQTDDAIANAVAAVNGPEQHTITIDASAFDPTNTAMTTTSNVNGAFLTDDAACNCSATLQAPLSIPVGATIDSITYYYKDNTATGITFALALTDLQNNSSTAATGTSFNTSVTSPNFATHTVSDLNFVVPINSSLAIAAASGGSTWVAAGTNLAIKGAAVTYTMP